MDANRRSFSRRLAVLCTAAFLTLVGIGVGCSSDDDFHSTQTNFYGVYSDPGASATISLFAVSAATGAATLGGESPITVVGEITINGTVTDLIGLWYVGSGLIHFETDDGFYIFDGQVSGSVVSGTSTGPNGGGSFVLFVGGTSSNVATYCASAVCTLPVNCNESGFFNFANAGSTSLLVIDYGGAIFVASGAATSTTVDYHIVQSGVDFTIEGNISGSAISGTWFDDVNNISGVFTGSSAACTTTKRR